MKFRLVALQSGWMDSQIKHNDSSWGFSATNIFGGDFPADLMTVLYESISGKVTRMVGWSNENSDFGMLIEPHPNGTYQVGFVSIVYWGELAFTDPEKDKMYGQEAMKILDGCRVHEGPVSGNPCLAVDTIGILTEEQIFDFARSFLAEYTKFFGKIGQKYYEDNWIYGSDTLGELIDGFPCYEYMQLSMLLDQKTKEMQTAAK